MWDVLQTMKEGRSIMLTTHFMEEADVLGDRIAIMSEGQVKCTGSPMFLKSNLGAGFSLTITKDSKTANKTSATKAPPNSPVAGAGATGKAGAGPLWILREEENLFTAFEDNYDEMIQEHTVSIFVDSNIKTFKSANEAIKYFPTYQSGKGTGVQ